MMADDEIFLTAEELAARWRYTMDTLANMRSRRVGLPFVKTPGGKILYRASDVLDAELNGTHGITLQRVTDAIRQCPHISDEKVRAKVISWMRTQLKR